MRTITKLGAALAFAQAHHDLLTTAAMRADGLSPRDIRQLRHDGVIERIVRGLYRLAGSRTRLQDIAACLLRHPAAAASHVSALYVHDMEVEPPRRPHFTVPEHAGQTTPLGVAHRSPLAPADVTMRKGLRVTTLARERVEAAPGRAGLGRLRAVLASWTDAIEPDSVAEAAAIRRIRSFGLTAPVTQHEVFDEAGTFVARLDMAWPDRLVGREYVSARWHRPDRLEVDEVRLQRLEGLGWSMDNLYRYQLQPNEVEWLRTLAVDLAGGRTASA